MFNGGDGERSKRGALDDANHRAALDVHLDVRVVLGVGEHDQHMLPLATLIVEDERSAAGGLGEKRLRHCEAGGRGGRRIGVRVVSRERSRAPAKTATGRFLRYINTGKRLVPLPGSYLIWIVRYIDRPVNVHRGSSRLGVVTSSHHSGSLRHRSRACSNVKSHGESESVVAVRVSHMPETL